MSSRFRQLRRAVLGSTTLIAAVALSQVLTVADGPAQDDPDVPFVFGFSFVQLDEADQKAEPAADQQAADDPVEEGAKSEEGTDKSDDGEGNPLARKFIRNLFKGVDTTKPLIKKTDNAELIPLEHSASLRDATDALAPIIEKVANALDKARKDIDNERADVAMERLQQVLDFPDDSLVRTQAGRAISTRLIANRMLAKLGQDLLDRYELQHGATATQLLAKAQETGDVRVLVDVASRFLNTEAGREAADQLGTMHLDRGEFGMASRWFSILWEFNADQTIDPRWKIKAALAYRESGREDEIQSLFGDASQSQNVNVAGQTVDRATWLKDLPSMRVSVEQTVEDWLTLYGDSDRIAKVEGGTPVLLPRWTVPITENRLIQQQIGDIGDDLEDEKKAIVPSLFPITVGGKIAFRTLRGVQMVDVESGDRLWQTREGWSAERLLTGERRTDGAQFRSKIVRNGVLVSNYQGTNADTHQLTSLLYRDGVYGLISSDGHRLYVLEDHSIFPAAQRTYSPFGRNTVETDKLGRDWSTNKLVAYDLKSGRLEWEIGGVKLGEQLDLTLAGHSFYGVPVLDDGELLLVGENNDREIRVFGLNPESGKPNWSQLIGYCDASIEEDKIRRWWLSQIAVQEGVLVAPTTTGWLVAIDRLNHSMLWAYRYKPPQENRGNSSNSKNKKNTAGHRPLNSRWSPSAPIVAGKHVIYTPTEEETIVCLEIFSGKKVWQAPKSSFLYLAGVFENRVLLVGKSVVSALDVVTGTTLWTRPLTADYGQPSGRGIAVGDQYLLPLSSGQLIGLNIADGNMQSQLFQPQDSAPLGNLIMHQGLLLSMTAEGMTAFEQREPLVERIATHQAEPTAILLDARLRYLDRKPREALMLLTKITKEDLDGREAEQFAALNFDTRAELVAGNPEDAEELLTQLQDWSRTKKQTEKLRMLTAGHYRNSKQYSKAIDHYWALINDSNFGGHSETGTVARNDLNRMQVSADSWLSGQLQDLWDILDEPNRADFTARVEAAFNDEADLENRIRMLNQFHFHPLASKVRLEVLKQHLSDGSLAAAQQETNTLIRIDASEALTAQRLLIDAFIANKEFVEAKLCLSRLEEKSPKASLADGTTVAEFAESVRSRDGWKAASQFPRMEWTSAESAIQTAGADYNANSIKTLSTEGLTSPRLVAYEYQLNQNLNRLTILDKLTREIHWSLPLRGTSSHGQIPKLYQTGVNVVLAIRGSIYCISPFDRQIVWTAELDVPRSSSSSTYYGSANDNREKFHYGTTLLQIHSLNSSYRRSGQGAVLAANDSWLCYRDRRGFRLVDMRDGSVKWKFTGTGPNTYVTLTDDYVIANDLNRSKHFVFRAIDGAPIDVSQIEDVMRKSVAIHGNSMLMLEEKSGFSLFGLGGSRPTMRLYDPFAGKNIWEQKLTSNSGIAKLPGGRFYRLENGNEISQLNIATGDYRTVATVKGLSAGSSGRTIAVTDRHNMYIVSSRERNHSSFYSEIRTVAVSGKVWCVDLQSGETLWEQNLAPQQHLTVDNFSNSPILLLSKTSYEKMGNVQFYSMYLKALDKRTGKEWASYRLPTSGFQGVTFNLPERFVEVRTYNARVRMKSIDDHASNDSSGETGE